MSKQPRDGGEWVVNLISYQFFGLVNITKINAIQSNIINVIKVRKTINNMLIDLCEKPITGKNSRAILLATHGPQIHYLNESLQPMLISNQTILGH